ncbi:MAG TPA: DUF5683 domain-containing protein, partial [Candidatus Kapabacteria bacterium]|nr:DUF5683 domain-containing protein [Candidatus Kapabacteria bacterium]
DSLRLASDTSVFVMKKSPLLATLLSAALPGAGQFYNEDYIKIPFIWAAVGFFGYEVISNNNQFIKYQDMYFNSPDSTIRGTQQYFNLKEQYRDDRDSYFSFFVLAYALNILDAYVGAHLFDFNVGDSHIIQQARFAPYYGTHNDVGLSFQLQFR